MTTNVYILKLVDDKYYVGKSDDPWKRFKEHAAGSGSAWTSKYKPITMEVIPNVSPFDEDKYVKESMSKYGIDNVRGGSYVTTKLTNAQIELLKTEIRGATDCCVYCGKKGHFIKACPIKADIDNNVVFQKQKFPKKNDLSDSPKLSNADKKSYSGKYPMKMNISDALPRTEQKKRKPVKNNDSKNDSIDDSAVSNVSKKGPSKKSNSAKMNTVDDVIPQMKQKNDDSSLSNVGRKWTPDDERTLCDLAVKGKALNEIAQTLKRNDTAVNSRMDKIICDYVIGKNKTIQETMALTGMTELYIQLAVNYSKSKLESIGKQMPVEEKPVKESKVNYCARCSRKGHYVDDCYADTDADGYELDDQCMRCGREGHNRNDCFAKTDVDGEYLE
jgi:hypothetical protein